MADFANADALERESARRDLIDLGRAATPSLLNALVDKRAVVRWEAAKALKTIADPAAAKKLVTALADEDKNVRWVAGTALIALGQDALLPLVSGLMSHPDSVWLHGGAHHVLNDFASGEAAGLLDNLLKAFEHPEPELAVPVAAEELYVQLMLP